MNYGNFFEVLEKGCCILHIDFYYEEENKIIVENDKLPLTQKYSFTEFQDYFTQHSDELG